MSSAMAEEDLAEILWGSQPRRDYFARGRVESVAGARVSVSVKGTTVTLPKLASCAPTAGDVVLVLMMPTGGVVIGKFG